MASHYRNMLSDARARGLSFSVGESARGYQDYKRGQSVKDAVAMIDDLEESVVSVFEERAGKHHLIGTATIIPSLDVDEQIADCSGWCNNWVDEAGYI